MRVDALEGKKLRINPPEPGPFVLTALALPAIVPNIVGVDGDGTLTLDRDLTPGRAYRLTSAAGDEALFAGYRSPSPSSGRLQLWTMLPRANRRADATGDLARFVACLQDVVDLLLARVDAFADWVDFERAPDAVLDHMLDDLGSPFGFPLSTLDKRRLLAILVPLYRQKGTKPGIRNAIRFFLGIEIDTVNAVQEETLVLGESELGVSWILAPSERAALYSFEVTVDRLLAPRERRAIEDIVLWAKPAHTHLLGIREPLAPSTDPRWILGLGVLGDTTELS